MLQFILFTDDTTILFSDKDISNKVDLINMELKEVTNWFKTNKLSVNASKTNFMIPIKLPNLKIVLKLS